MISIIKIPNLIPTREKVFIKKIFLRKIIDVMGNIGHDYFHGGRFEFHQLNE